MSIVRPNLSKADLGEATRQMICARLMLNSVKVFRPMTEDTPIDLLVLAGNRVLKCQCKYIFPDARGAHTMNLYSVRKNGPGSKAVKHKYTVDEVDFFLGYCMANDGVYVYPFAACGGRSTLTIRIGDPAKGRNQHDGIDHSAYLNAFSLLLPP